MYQLRILTKVTNSKEHLEDKVINLRQRRKIN